MSTYTFSTCTATVNIISTLDDLPNDVGGLTAAELKAKFDLAGTELKTFINNVFIPSIQTNYATTSDIIGIVTGDIPDNSLAESKLAFSVATQNELDTFRTNLKRKIRMGVKV